MKGYITKEQLSDSLKEYLQTLGLTQEQVNTVITRVSGDLSLLETTAKDSLVNAINENKTSIHLANENISTLQEELFGCKDTLKRILIDKGLEVTDEENNLSTLIDKVGTMRVASLLTSGDGYTIYSAPSRFNTTSTSYMKIIETDALKDTGTVKFTCQLFSSTQCDGCISIRTLNNGVEEVIKEIQSSGNYNSNRVNVSVDIPVKIGTIIRIYNKSTKANSSSYVDIAKIRHNYLIV